eukprot:297543_1
MSRDRTLTHCPETGARYRLMTRSASKSAPATGGVKYKKKHTINSADYKLKQLLIRIPTDDELLKPIQYPTIGPMRKSINYLLNKYLKLKNSIAYVVNKIDRLEDEVSELQDKISEIENKLNIAK